MTSGTQQINWRRRWEQLGPSADDISTVAAVQQTSASNYTENLTAIRCLIMLGPPGTGKSTELKKMYDGAMHDGAAATFIELRNIPSLEALRRAIADNVPLNADWSVFIDGLDEAPAQQRDVHSWLISTFAELASRRTLPRLRLTCRSADWPDQLREDLSALWGPSDTKVFQLTELTLEDVELAAAQRLPDLQSKFILEISAKGMWPLAKAPVTLGMLEKIFVSFNGSLPTSLIETYRQGILSLVEERRRPTSVTSDAGLTVFEKLRLLGRIATVSMLSGKQVIWGGLFSDPVSDDAIAVTDLAGGSELGLSHPLIADERALREALRTAIFQSDGPHRAKWIHLSFAEFLAADYLAQRNAAPAELLDLLSVTGDEEKRIVPHLREVAAWLAGMNPPFRNLLVTTEPDLLLRSDVASADQSFKEALTKELLDRLSHNEVLDVWRDPRRDFTRLNYGGLYAVLRPYILNKELPEAARSFAIFIARDCGLKEAANDLFKIGLDASDDPAVRATAIFTLGPLRGDMDLTPLKALLALRPADDPKDEIRGSVLSSLWPNFITVPELFAALSAPNDDTTFGLYKSFLYKLKFGNLSREGAHAALHWISSLNSNNYLTSHFGEIIESALLAAWAVAYEDKSVLKAFAEMLLAHAKDHIGAIGSVNLATFKKVYYDSGAARHGALVEQVALAADDAQKAIVAALYGPWTLFEESDLLWVLEELQKGNADVQEVLVRSALLLIGQRHPDEVPFVWDAAEKIPALRTALTQWFTTDISSPVAAWNKESHEKKKRLAEIVEPPAPSLLDELEKLIALADKEPGDWWRINYLLLNFPGSDASELNGNLKASKHWSALKDQERKSVISGAHRFLIEYSLPDLEWVGRNINFRPAAAGYRALRLLYDQDGGPASLPENLIAKWTPSVLWFQTNDLQEEFSIRKELSARAYEADRERIYEALTLITERATHVQDVIRLIEGTFDPQIGNILSASLSGENLEIHSKDQIIATLIGKRFLPILERARKLSTGLLDDDSSREITAPDTYLLAAWFTENPSEAWPFIWPLRLAHPEIARAIWLRIAGFDYRDWPVLAKLTSQQAGEIFEYLAAIYPGDDRVSGFVGPDDQLRMMLTAILDRLAKDGSEAAVGALVKVQIAFPDDARLPWYLKRAREHHRSSSWKALAPRDVIRRLGFANAVTKSRTASLIAAIQTEAASEVDAKASLGVAVSASDAAETAATTLEIRPAANQFNILFVATEWKSGHGGLSTLNREFCVALSKKGHRVICLVTGASEDEIQEARSVNVELIALSPMFGYFGDEVLDVCVTIPALPFQPDFVVGHDHKTGRAALRIQRSFFSQAKYLHVVHTNPEEIDQYKQRGLAAGAKIGGDKGSRQEQLCDAAFAVIAVGLTILDHLKARVESSSKLFCLIPGMKEDYLLKSVLNPEDREIEVLWTGRTDAPVQKGIPVVMTVAQSLHAKKYAEARTPKFVIRGVDFDRMKDSDWDQYGVDKANLKFREYTSDVNLLTKDLRAASCVLMPSMTEAFGLTALDAISHGVPVLMSSRSGIGYLVTKELTARGLNGLAQEIVIDVTDDIAASAKVWEEALDRILSDRTAAFDRASVLRNILKDSANWVKSVSDFEDFLGRLSNEFERGVADPVN